MPHLMVVVWAGDRPGTPLMHAVIIHPLHTIVTLWKAMDLTCFSVAASGTIVIVTVGIVGYIISAQRVLILSYHLTAQHLARNHTM